MTAQREGGASIPRRDFLRQSMATAGALGAVAGTHGQAAGAAPGESVAAGGRDADERSGSASPITHQHQGARRMQQDQKYNGPYSGDRLSRVAFPLGGIGAGMVCLEGTGALSHLSLRHQPDVFNEPVAFGAVCVKGKPNVARLIEGPVPGWKLFGQPSTGNGAHGKHYGLPRFRDVAMTARFPFATIEMADEAVPLKVELTGWSPFEPGDADNASLPVAALEYRFTNPTKDALDAVFSFNAQNLIRIGHEGHGVRNVPGGFAFSMSGSEEKPWEEGHFCARVTDPAAKVNGAWFRGGWFDTLTMVWRDIRDGACYEREPWAEGAASPGATIFVPFTLGPGASKTVTVQLSWYVGRTNQFYGADPEPKPESPGTYTPWYAGRFADVDAVAAYWQDHYDALRQAAQRFSACFYDMTLPDEVIEAVAANLTILKSPTVLRQADGRLWAWEGCTDNHGCCHGTCTHVWNYAQAIPHLFPSLERTLRETEFTVSQNEKGHQAFRASLPIRPTVHDFHSAADGQLGGIMKVHRDWRISGDTDWLRTLWPPVRASLDYCIDTWDPKRKGIVEEPHHNTYDIEFWGPNGMCTSFYLGALAAAVRMGEALGDDVSGYAELLEKGTRYLETELFNGEYFFQKIQWEGLRAPNPIEAQTLTGWYSAEGIELYKKEGPKYQYGNGCLSDGVLGSWMAAVCGVGQVLDAAKVTAHLRSIHRYNLKKDLSAHANPQRPTFACGAEGGLLLCTWPKGGELSLPFVYSDEVWTGIEYQVASHLMAMGAVEEGLEIVRTCRDRYDGCIRNPFNEYECGHWYARAMASYALLQGLTGARYDAVEKVLYLKPTIKGDFRVFLATATGYGTAGVRDGRPFLDVKGGTIDAQRIDYKPFAA